MRADNIVFGSFQIMGDLYSFVHWRGVFIFVCALAWEIYIRLCISVGDLFVCALAWEIYSFVR